jgi:Glycosyl transferase 4-like domain
VSKTRTQDSVSRSFPLRILLLTCHFEPSDPASERWAHLSRHLQDQGLGLVLLEVQAGRALDAVALGQAQRMHGQRAFDVVISSGAPVSAHLTGQAFSRTTGIAWVADWPEPFALESHQITGWFDRRFEARLVRAADQVLVSSQALARKYRALRGNRDASLLLVRNGFERDELRSSHRRAECERLRIVCSQTSNFNPLPFLETLQARTNLRESLEVIFTMASAQVIGLVEAFELDDCVHCLAASDVESVALEGSADALLSFGLNSAYRSPMGLARVLARQRPFLHVFENVLDPSFEVLADTPHLSSQNNRFALTAALETAIQGDWVMPGEVSGLPSVRRHCWDVIAQTLGGFVCLAGSGRASSDRASSGRASSDRASSDRASSGQISPEMTGSSTVTTGLSHQKISSATAKI